MFRKSFQIQQELVHRETEHINLDMNRRRFAAMVGSLVGSCCWLVDEKITEMALIWALALSERRVLL